MSACGRSATRARAVAGAACEQRADHGGGARHAARCRQQQVFWILFATFFICGASTNGLIQVHLIPMCLDFGIPQVQAASLLAAMGVFDFFGTILSGWLSDRYDNRWLLFWYYGLRGLSLLFLPFSDFSFYGLSLFAMFYGLDWIATVPPTVRLTAQRFGPNAPIWCSAGFSPAINWARALPPSAPACRGRCSRPICRRSSSPARSVLSRR